LEALYLGTQKAPEPTPTPTAAKPRDWKPTLVFQYVMAVLIPFWGLAQPS